MIDPSLITALALLPTHEDRLSLTAIFHRWGWRLDLREGLADSRVLLKELETGVVISACDLPDGNWKEVLQEMQRKSAPLPMIVVSRLADERLWAEVLNLGGYDVLPTPFDTNEVLHSVTLAWQHSLSKGIRRMRVQPGKEQLANTAAVARHFLRISKSR